MIKEVGCIPFEQVYISTASPGDDYVYCADYSHIPRHIKQHKLLN